MKHDTEFHISSPRFFLSIFSFDPFKVKSRSTRRVLALSEIDFRYDRLVQWIIKPRVEVLFRGGDYGFG